MKTGTILLAAGNSSRLGKPKQLIKYKGNTLLQSITDIALSATQGPVIVVEGHKNYPLTSHPRLKKVVNLDWKKGMGSSLKLGLKMLMENDLPDQVLVLLSDQPMVGTELIQDLLDAKANSRLPIAASYYHNTPGVPAIFDKSVLDKLEAMPDEEGAKKILMSNPELVALVNFEAGKIDIDTPSDLIALKKSDWGHFDS
ncbi:nucleotidyltransferase family protein [Cyclobacterium qasimii]|uniref:CTP:molybdopterin cytidylyltransferase n=2 Tax=Cyclobacterium qasimii TaxID=1350429 RepID=S7VCT9_9BACT|nr:nucleotidyltransferase family protein [Cyclobacterium qasimii]EPR67786.1 CTP:molybdopterin cytidylyltransferase [Cyclobacterium qasimii M12-11B]GEO20377.1 4-diphosphocytidyl-2C-methyl-D-erythritol synthase [Cyclobacterium qasimii]